MVNGTAVLTVENAETSNQGIYSASYVGDSPLRGAWMRLIVRGLLDQNVHDVKTKMRSSKTFFFCKAGFNMGDLLN